MNIGITVLVYLLAVALGASCGTILGMAASTRHRAAMYLAGTLIVGVVVGGGFLLGNDAPWIGPIFTVSAVVTGILMAATVLGDDPALRGEFFGRRVLLALSPQRLKAEQRLEAEQTASRRVDS